MDELSHRVAERYLEHAKKNRSANPHMALEQAVTSALSYRVIEEVDSIGESVDFINLLLEDLAFQDAAWLVASFPYKFNEREADFLIKKNCANYKKILKWRTDNIRKRGFYYHIQDCLKEKIKHYLFFNQL